MNLQRVLNFFIFVEEFGDYFSNYGTVVRRQIMKDRTSGNSRGFGFVTFDSEEAVEKVLANIKEHKLLDKWVECKKATPNRTTQPPTTHYQKEVT